MQPLDERQRLFLREVLEEACRLAVVEQVVKLLAIDGPSFRHHSRKLLASCRSLKTHALRESVAKTFVGNVERNVGRLRVLVQLAKSLHVFQRRHSRDHARRALRSTT